MRKRGRRRNERKKDEKAPQEKYKAKNERNIGRKKTEGWEQESVRGRLGGAGGEFGGKRMEVDEERGMGK